MPSFISSPVLFLSFCRSEFLIYIIFLLSKEPGNISRKTGLVATNSLNFCFCKKIFISPLLFKDNFIGYRILSWQFFSQHFKYYIPLSCLHDCQGEVGCNSYLCSAIGKVFFPHWFQDFFLFDFSEVRILHA